MISKCTCENKNVILKAGKSENFAILVLVTRGWRVLTS